MVSPAAKISLKAQVSRLNEVEPIEKAHGDPRAQPGAPLLEIDKLQTHFFTAGGVVRAVDGVSCDVRAGGVLGIVGESGCGKSVTALSILPLVPDPPGRIVAGAIRFHTPDLLTLLDCER